MFEDIVERLRKAEMWKAESWSEHNKRYRSITYLNALPGIIEEAADEIERLRGALERIERADTIADGRGYRIIGGFAKIARAALSQPVKDSTP